ncbi:hypothetical protein GHT06_005864 [Daphnia sinensis]|uniref:Integrase catalytic domain-containing protein n=1 Tax=Daphnia sinensis TaxID=1820382 RepID=A0AAD5KWP3_9CRUS|nr:hypothetical protein GHT06_005864 [Daphnia sinensis]
MRNQTAQTIAKILVNKIFTKYGSPEVVLTDQGTNFLSSLIEEVCKLFKIRRIRTTAYHPQTDGLVERFNRTLCDMLACYVADEPEKWDKYLPFVTFAYNTAKQASIRETPFYLFFGREPIMPNDIKINRRYETGKKPKNWQENISSKQQQDRKNTTTTTRKCYSDVNYEIQHVENKKLKSIVHANGLKLYTPRKEESTKKETTNNPTTVPEKIEQTAAHQFQKHYVTKSRIFPQMGATPKLQTSLSSIQTILLTLFLLQNINPTHPIYATVCDCNNVKIRGILDLESPYYCNNDAMEKQHSTRIPTSYTLITNQKPAATWKGWTCRQWTKTKKITGSFWIGSFDTIYSQETKLITPLECWRMVNDKKCGENNMQTGPTSISFTATPTGYLEIPRTPEINNSSRLYDDVRQIEISFLNKPDKDVAATGFKVTGIPLTYLTFPAETTKILYETFKDTINICLKNTNLITSVCEEYRDLYKSRPQRSLLQEVQFLFNTPIKDEQLGIRLYSISYAWGLFDWYTRKQKLSTKKEKYYNRMQHSTSLTNLETATH